MEIQKIHALCFSPTGTTRRVVSHVAESVAALYANVPLEIRDFTLPGCRERGTEIGNSELVIMELPVYAGRLPNLLLKYLVTWKSEGALAVPVVVYGNRSYGNALIELRDILENGGFHTIAAAAFVGQHSFSGKLATGRPDEEDLERARQFAAGIVEKTEAWGEKEFSPVKVPGCGMPDYGGYYKPKGIGGEMVNFLKVKPVTSDCCIHCRRCAKVCPMGAIDPENPFNIPGICIKCNACLKICPTGSKQLLDEAYLSHVRHLETTFIRRSKVELFY